MGEHTPSWFWPVFLIGGVLVCSAVLVSGAAGVALLASRIETGDQPRACGPGGCGTPRVYVPPRTPIALAPPVPVAPQPPVAPPGEGSLSVELVVHESHGRAAPREGSTCTLEIDFEGAGTDGLGACHGILRCGARTLWHADADEAIDCRVARGDAALRMHDAGFSADDGRPVLDVDVAGGIATLTLVDDARGRRGAYSLIARAD